MDEKVKETSISKFYKREPLLTNKQIEKMSASEIVGLIAHIAKDNQTHILWEDCCKWMDFKMCQIKKLVSYLEQTKPNILRSKA